MNIIQGAVHFVANNKLTFEKGPMPIKPYPSAANQVGHKNKLYPQPSMEEILPKLETPAVKVRIADLLSRYPEPQGALLEVLWVIQEVLGWVPRESIRWASKVCDCSPAHAYGVVTFYTMYKQVPTGRYLLQFCRNICCEQKGASGIIAYTEKALKIKTGETTPDGLFTIVQVECLGACGNAPVMLVNDEFATDVEGGKLTMRDGITLTPERVDKILKWCYDRSEKYEEEPVRDALGGTLVGHKGHPGAPGSSAKPQEMDYAPACPVLGLKAVAEKSGVTLTWKNAPEFTHLVVERADGSSWKKVGEPSVKDKEFIDPTGLAGMAYRMIATSGDRVAKPSTEEKAVQHGKNNKSMHR